MFDDDRQILLDIKYGEHLQGANKIILTKLYSA